MNPCVVHTDNSLERLAEVEDRINRGWRCIDDLKWLIEQTRIHLESKNG